MTSCIDIEFSRLDAPIAPIFERVDAMQEVTFSRLDSPIEPSFSREGEPLEVVFSRVDLPIDFTMSIVCSVENEYLRVVPMDVVWLTEGNDYAQDVEVYANVNWHIE